MFNMTEYRYRHVTWNLPFQKKKELVLHINVT